MEPLSKLKLIIAGILSLAATTVLFVIATPRAHADGTASLYGPISAGSDTVNQRVWLSGNK
jgi:hypothetical protein